MPDLSGKAQKNKKNLSADVKSENHTHHFLFWMGLSITSLFYKTRVLMVFIPGRDEMFADIGPVCPNTKRKAAGCCMTMCSQAHA